MKIHDRNLHFNTKWIVSVVILLLSLFLTSQSSFFPGNPRVCDRDPAVYQYLGHLISIGKFPYVDAFDHKGLLLYYINAFGYIISKDWGMWLIDFLVMVGIGTVGYKIIRKYNNWIVSLIVTVVILSCISLAFQIGDTPDYYSLLFSITAILLLCEYYEIGNISNLKIVLIGICIANIFWLKFTMTAGVLMFCFIIIIDAAVNKKWGFIGSAFLYFTIGFAIPTSIVLIILLKHHAVGAMIQDYFFFSASYVNYNNANGNISVAISHFFVRPCNLIALISIEIYLFSILLQHKERIWNRNLLLIIISTVCLVFSVFSISLAGNSYSHYEMICYPFVFLNVSVACVEFVKVDLTKNKFFFAIVLTIVTIIVNYNISESVNQHIRYWQSKEEADKVISIICENVPAGSNIAVTDPYSCEYYTLTNCESSSHYPYIQREGMYDTDEFWTVYIEELSVNIPEAIVWFRVKDAYSIMGDFLNDYELVHLGIEEELYLRKQH